MPYWGLTIYIPHAFKEYGLITYRDTLHLPVVITNTQYAVDGMPHGTDSVMFNKVLLAKIVHVPVRTNNLK